MKKEDYLKLSKERLAELLEERDREDKVNNFNRLILNSGECYYPPCFTGGPCTNPFHDCINCPRQFTGGYGTTIATAGTTTTVNPKPTEFNNISENIK